MPGSTVRVRHLLPFVGAAVVTMAACTGSNGEPITVTVTPTPASVLTCSTTQFTAAVTGTTDLSIDWYVTPASGSGTFGNNGAYHAPAATPAPPNNSVTVTASRSGNPTQFDTTPPFTLATAFPSAAAPITGSTGDLEGGLAIGVYQHAGASNGNTVYAVWSVNSSATEVKMMIARSDDGGATWNAAVPAIDAAITDTNGGSIDCPAIAVDPGNPNIVYATGMVDADNSITHAIGDPTNNPAFVLAVSTNGGQTFSNTVLSTVYAGIGPC
jgi:hypothetical protein